MIGNNILTFTSTLQSYYDGVVVGVGIFSLFSCKEFQKQMDSVDLQCSYKFDPNGVQVKGETNFI